MLQCPMVLVGLLPQMDAYHLAQDCYTPKREILSVYDRKVSRSLMLNLFSSHSLSALNLSLPCWSCCWIPSLLWQRFAVGRFWFLQSSKLWYFFFMTDSHASVRLIVASISLQTGTQPPAQPSKCLKCLSEQWGCWRRSRFVELVLCWKHHWWWWGFHIHWKSEERRYNGQVFWTR